MSALPPKADINGRSFDVCFVPEADIQEREPLFGVLRASSLLSSWAADRHPGSAHPRNRHSRAPGRWSRTTKQASSSSTGQAAGRGEVALLDNARNCYLRTKGALTPAGQTKPLALQQYGRPCCNHVLISRRRGDRIAGRFAAVAHVNLLTQSGNGPSSGQVQPIRCPGLSLRGAAMRRLPVRNG